MLNLNEIAARIKQPGLCGTQDIDSLKTLCGTYPYSQVFPLLYLKTLAQTNDVRLDSELQQFAYRIADRAVLFDLLSSKNPAETANTAEPDTDTSLPGNISFRETANLTGDVRSADSIPSMEEDGEKDIVPEEAIVSASEEDKTENTSIIAPVLSEERIEIDDTNNKETELVPAETEKSPSEEKNIPAPPISGEKKTIEIHREEDLPSLPDDALTALNIGVEVYSLEAEEAKIAQQKQLEDAEEKALEQEKQKLIAALAQNNPIAESSKDKINEPTDQGRSFTSWLKHNAAHIQQEEEKPETALIDRFIESGPKISHPKEKLFEDRTDKNEMFNPTKKARKSLDESHLPVSETLAKIFAAQGNYPKAIYAYQQLMLIFPEKKVFFASQIEELNKKLNT